MAVDEIARLRFYQRQFLGAEDMEAQQEYHRDMRRRHSLGAHRWGIVSGLELIEKAREGGSGAVDVFVQPGMAVDGYGREIIVFAPSKLDVELFASFTNTAHHKVYLAYQEDNARLPAAGYGLCDATDQSARVIESFHVVVDPLAPTHANVLVDGKAIAPPADPPIPGDVSLPPDESVAFQELPEDDLDRWLVPLGSVQWNGAQQQFIPSARLTEGREYIGVIAAQVLAPVDRVRVKKRSASSPPAPLTPDKDVEFAAIEGSLRVDDLLTARNGVQLNGGQLELRDMGGTTNAPTLQLYRDDSVGLRIRLGDEGAGNKSLQIGIKDPFEDKVIIKDNGSIVTRGALDVGGHVLANERIELRDASGGIDTDILWIERHNNSANHNDLRLVIGDDQSGDDQFVVGPIAWQDGQFKEKFRVTNGGDGWVARNLQVARDLTVGGVVSDGIGRVRVGVDGNDAAVITRPADVNQGAGYHNLYLRTNNDAGGHDVVVDLDNLRLGRDLFVQGNLRVMGTQNLVHVVTRTMRVKNAGYDTPAAWTCWYVGEFSGAPYAVFAVLQGFSLWDNTAHPNFDNWSHGRSVSYIPQHVFVRVDGSDANSASGVAYCSESTATVSEVTDNTILFTVVAIGKGV